MEKGVTLIELMIVVAVIAILAMFALPAFQDYTRRTHVAEGIQLAGGAKLATTEYYSTVGKWPNSNNDAGLSDTINGNAVESIKIVLSSEINTYAIGALLPEGFVADDAIGGLEITYNGKVSSDDDKRTIVLIALTKHDDDLMSGYTWNCTAGTVDDKYRPANCRNDI